MAYITVNQIIDVFRDIADRHLMINDFGNGPTYNIGAADELKFPYLWVENGDINTVFSANGMREKRLTFNLFLMDKINKGDDNFDEIISDTEFILSGIIQEFSQLPFYVQNKLSLFQDINLTPVVEATDDNVNGWQATISLKIPIPYTYCEMPIRPFVTPVTPDQPCVFQPIQIQNSAGCILQNITVYPTSGITTLPNIELFDGATSLGNYASVQRINFTTECGIDDAQISLDGCELNIDLGSCFPIDLTNRYGCVIDQILTNPNGEFGLPNTFINDDNGLFIEESIGRSINIIGGTLSALTTSVDGCETNLFLNEVICEDCFPIRLLNSNDCELDVIESCPNDCTGYTWTVVVRAGASVTNLRLLDCNGENYLTIPSLTPGTYTYCHSSLTQPSADAIFGLVQMSNTFEVCQIDYRFTLPDVNVTDNVSFTASTASPNNIIVSGGTIASITSNDCDLTINVNAENPYPINIVNDNDCVLATITGDTAGEFRMPDIVIEDQSGVTGLTQAPKGILIQNADILTTASSPDGCNLIINVDVPSVDGVFLIQHNAITITDYLYNANLPNLYRIPDSIDNVYMTAFGGGHMLAIRNFVPNVGGELWVWGVNTTGAIGGQPNYQWTQIGVDTDWTFVAAGGNASMAIKAGALYGAGAGAFFVFGNNSTSNLSTFTQIGVDTDWEMVSIGDQFSLGIKGGDLVSCGSNNNFKTGLNTSAGNTQIWTVANSGETWSYVNAGREHAMAVTTDGKLFTWGTNNNGRTAQGTTAGQTQIPTQVGSDTDWVMGSCGNQNVYAIKTNGTAWGAGSGNGSIWGNFGLSPDVMTQDSTLATDWNWIMATTANSVIANKTDKTLYGAGLAFANALPTNQNSLTQVGTTTNNEINYYSNHFGFTGQIGIIRS